MENTDFSTKVLSQKERMYRLAVSLLRDSAEAEDAVQDVMERLWIKRGQLDGYGNLNAFILTSVRNACLDRIRTRKMRAGKKELLTAAMPAAEDPRPLQELSDMKSVAEAVIAALPEKQRMIIHLRDVEGFPMEEIAQVMRMEADSVRVYLSRARRTVREKMVTIMNYGIH
ncbi:MAG: RNA polymerase sigma factor [Alistipes sp.]|nr:RNA polymerase sigma factor [Alistipes sp.]